MGWQPSWLGFSWTWNWIQIWIWNWRWQDLSLDPWIIGLFPIPIEKHNLYLMFYLPETLVQMNIEKLFRHLNIANWASSLCHHLSLAQTSVQHIHNACVFHLWRLCQVLDERLGGGNVEPAHPTTTGIFLHRGFQRCSSKVFQRSSINWRWRMCGCCEIGGSESTDCCGSCGWARVSSVCRGWDSNSQSMLMIVVFGVGDVRGVGWLGGVIAAHGLMNLRFLKVTRPEPRTLIRYWR